MSETNNKGKKCWHLPAFYLGYHLGQRVRCDEKFDGRDYTYIPLAYRFTIAALWDGGLSGNRSGECRWEA